MSTNNQATPVKVTVDSGFSPRYERFGFLRSITDTHVVLTTAKSERYATSAIPLVSVVDIDDVTVEQVDANARVSR